jgi:hypothetical protein
MLFTVLGARSVSAAFSRCTSSVVISSRRVLPNAFTRCTRITVSFDAMPLGFNRFAFAYPSRNRQAKSFNVGICCVASFCTGLGLPWTSSTRSRASAHFCAASLLDAEDFLRSRTTLPSGSWTRMSTSHPPFTYGRTVTLIAVTPSAMARASGRASLANRRSEQDTAAQPDNARQLARFDHCVHSAASGAEQVGRVVDREQHREGCT